MNEQRRDTVRAPIAAVPIVVPVFLTPDRHRSHRGLIQLSRKCPVDLHAGMRDDAAR